MKITTRSPKKDISWKFSLRLESAAALREDGGTLDVHNLMIPRMLHCCKAFLLTDVHHCPQRF